MKLVPNYAAAATGEPVIGYARTSTFTRGNGQPGTEFFQTWVLPAGEGGGPQTIDVTGLPPGSDVTVTFRGRAMINGPGDPANGTYELNVNTVPPGCTSCEVTDIRWSPHCDDAFAMTDEFDINGLIRCLGGTLVNGDGGWSQNIGVQVEVTCS